MVVFPTPPVDPEVSSYGEICGGAVLTFALGATSGGASIATGTFPHERADGQCYVTEEGVAVQEIGANPMSQEIVFTGTSGAERCMWEIEPSQANAYGRKIRARRGYFNTVAYIAIRKEFSELQSYPGQDIMTLRVYQVLDAPLEGKTLVATATISSSALDATTPGTSPGTSALMSGVSSDTLGAYTGTSIIKGTPSDVHTVFKSSDTASDQQKVFFSSRGYASSSVGVGVLFADNTVANSVLSIGQGEAAYSASAPTEIRMYAQLGVGAGTGLKKFSANSYGVNVGTAPAAPTSGRAFQVTTTAQTTAAYFDDAAGGLVMPWDATTASTDVQLAIGASSQLFVSVTPTASYIHNNAGSLNVLQSIGDDIHYRCTHATTGDHIFKTRGDTEVGSFGADGLVLPLDSGTAATAALRIGAGEDLSLYHNATDTIISSKTGLLVLSQESTSDLWIRANNATSGDIIFKTRGATEVGRFDANGLVLPLAGESGTPNLTIGNSSGLTAYSGSTTGSYLSANVSGKHFYLTQSSNGSIYISCGHASVGDIILRTRSSTEVGRFDALGLKQPDDMQIRLGDGDDFKLYHDGSLNYIYGGSHNVYIYAQGTNSGHFNADGMEMAAGKRISMVGQAGDVATPAAGDIEYNSTSNKHRGYDGTIWNDLY